MTSSPWWAPHVYADRRPFLAARNRISAAFRAWFAARDFAEVETAILQVSPGNEAHLHAFATELIAPDTSRTPLYLHTSPEFAAKKLLAAGEPRLFTFARVFRNRERTALHHPEFTMLEWYRANEPYGDADRRLRGADVCRRGSGRDAALCLPRPRGRSVRRAGAAHGGGGVPPLRRHRSARDARRSRRARRRRDGAGRCALPRTTPGPTCSAASSWRRSNQTSGSDARRSSTNTRSRKPPSRARPRTIRASPSASSSMSAASRSPTRSAS